MELDHMVLADLIARREDGKMDLHGVGWDTIFTDAVRVTHPRMDVAIRFLLSAQEVESPHTVGLSLVGEDGDELARLKAQVEPVTPEQSARIQPGRKVGIGMTLQIANAVFPRYGRYHLVLTWDGTEARQPLRLFVAPGPTP